MHVKDRGEQDDDYFVVVCFAVPNLKKDGEYEFRVRAKNAAGLSEPTDVIGPIKTKPKYSQ